VGGSRPEAAPLPFPKAVVQRGARDLHKTIREREVSAGHAGVLDAHAAHELLNVIARLETLEAIEPLSRLIKHAQVRRARTFQRAVVQPSRDSAELVTATPSSKAFSL
jgi:hypothetical protein